MKGIRDETFQRTKVCEDGGSAPWFDEQFKISYKPTEKKTGKIVHTGVVRMGLGSMQKEILKPTLILRRKKEARRQIAKCRKSRDVP